MDETQPTPRRKTVRLPEFDYAGNATYFITICTFHRRSLFGHIADGQMHRNALGAIVADDWHDSANIRSELDLHHMVIMPNHIHGLLTITPTEEGPIAAATQFRAPRFRRPRSLGSFVAGFKVAATKRINIEWGATGSPVWQPNYYDHIVRNERSFERNWDYIENNPTLWADDGENPESPKFRAGS